MADPYELNPCERLTVGTLGEPGHRTFYLQGIQGLDSYAVVVEKEQTLALATAIDGMLATLEEEQELPPVRPNRIQSRDLEMSLPVEERFRAARLGIGFEQRSGMVVVTAEGLISEEEEAEVRFWISRDQAAALARHARMIIEGGRPICPFCNQPIDPAGHFCPRRNGHSH